MVSLARASLLYEWRRFLAAILAVSFSGLLVLIQVALLLGTFSTVSSYIDYSNADLWIGYRNTPSVDLGRNIPASNEVFIRMNPEVRQIERLLLWYGDWRRPDGAALSVYVVGIDTRPNGLALAKRIGPQQRAMLDRPDTVLIDVAEARKLQARIGTVVEINGRRVKVAGMVSGLRAIGGANIIASLATTERLMDSTGRATQEATYFLARLANRANAEQVRKVLTPQGSRQPFSVWEAGAFSWQSQTYWLLESGAGTGVGFASMLGLMVGILITSQTLRSAILASLREYATLRALGVSLRSLRTVVLEQSFWVGLIGLCATAVTTSGVAVLAERVQVAMLFPSWLLISVAVLTVLIALGSGLLALKPLFQAEPAALLR